MNLRVPATEGMAGAFGVNGVVLAVQSSHTQEPQCTQHSNCSILIFMSEHVGLILINQAWLPCRAAITAMGSPLVI